MTHECWQKKILWIDLSNKTECVEEISDDILEQFIGGKGLGAYYLYRELDKNVDPLSKRNILLFLSGPLQGLPAPNVGRWSVVTKSPLTGLFLDSHCGGAVGREIKRSGYDILGVRNQSSTPIILRIEDDNVYYDDASDLWGKGVYQTTKLLHETYSDSHVVYVIGPAGENEVRFATGCCEVAHQTGRGGVGAVMGAKGIKALVVKGTKKISSFDSKGIRKVNKEFVEKWQSLDFDFKYYGTRHLVEVANAVGQFPAYNYRSGYFDKYEELDHVMMEEKYGLGNHHSCPHCIMRCTHALETENPEDKAEKVESMIEYETLGLLGGNLGISDPQGVLQLNYLCDDLGLDTISTGGVIGFAMDLYQQGILTQHDIGFSLEFGDIEAAIKLIKLIALKKGIGETLSHGVKVAANKIGDNLEQYAVHVKGLEVPAWDPRGRLGMGLLYATGDIGASHLRGWPPTSEAPDKSVVPIIEGILESRIDKTLKDCLVVCHFTNRLPLTFDQMIRMLNSASGMDYDMESIMEFGKRVETMTRMFNVREGISRNDDTLPKRFWEPQKDGPRKGNVSFKNQEDFEDSLSRYYELLGWNDDGVPTKNTLSNLGLSKIIEKQ